MKSANATIMLDEEREFDELGFLVISDVLSQQKIARLVVALDKLTQEKPDKTHNIADIIGLTGE